METTPTYCQLTSHFTARDIIRRWDVVGRYSQATASTTAHFLDKLEAEAPFTIRSIQIEAAQSLKQCVRKNANGVISSSLSCHHVHPSPTVMWSGLTEPILRNSIDC